MTDETADSAEAPDANPYEDEPFAASWFYDHPALGKALRSTFAEKRLGRAVFINILVLMVVFVTVQQLFTGGRLAFQSEEISFARTAFLAFAGVEVSYISMLLPMSFFGVFFTERKEQCFDQVVATGISPLRLLGGRLIMSMAFFGVVLLSALPFFVLTVIMRGPSLLDVASFYLVMAFWMLALGAVTCFSCVAMDDTGVPILYGLVASGGALAAGFSRKAAPAFAAVSPLRHVTIDNAPLMKALGLGSFAEASLFGAELPCELVSILVYLAAIVFAFGYVLVGPDMELTPGLNSFDTVAVGRKGEVIRGQRLLTSTLLRTLQIRFFYENSSPKLTAWSPVFRVFGATLFVFAANTWFLASLWPDQTPTSFGGAEKKFAYGYLLFCAASFMLLAFVGAQARSALRDRRAVLKLGGFAIGRFPFVFVVFALGLLYPVALTSTSLALTGFPVDVLPMGELLTLFGLAVLYATFTFCLAVFFAMVTNNPYSATGQSLLVLVGLNVLPFIWIIYFYFNSGGEGASWILDLSPFFAIYAVIRPEKAVPFSTIKDGKPFFHTHDPSLMPFVVTFSVLALIFLALGLWFSRRQRRQWDQEAEEAAQERAAILSAKPIVAGAAALALALLWPGAAMAQDGAAEPPSALEFALTQGYGDVASRSGFTPMQLTVTNNGGARNVSLEVSEPSGETVARFDGALAAQGPTRFEALVPARALAPSVLNIRAVSSEGEVITEAEVEHPALVHGDAFLVVDRTRGQPFDLSEIQPDVSVAAAAPSLGERRRGGGERWKPAFIAARELPSVSLALSGIRALLLGDPEGGIDRAKAEALAHWVGRGGDLILSVGDRGRALRQGPMGQAFGDGLAVLKEVEPLRGVSLAGLRRLYGGEALGGVAPAVAALDTRVAGVRVRLEGEAGEPLIITKPYGAGRITVVAFDLWQPPLVNAAEGAALITDLLGAPPEELTRADVLFPVLTTIQSSQAKIAPAFLALLIYAFISGPVFYWVLKPRKKGLMAWVLIPGMALLFAGLTPLYGFVLDESDSAYFGATLIESYEGTELAVETSDLLIFSGGRESHELTLRRAGAQAFTVTPRGRRSGGVNVDAAFTSLDENRHLRISPLKLAMWGTRYLSVENLRKDPVKLRGSLTPDKDLEVRIQLENEGRFKLSDIIVVFPAVGQGGVDLSYARLEELESGASLDEVAKARFGEIGQAEKDLFEMLVKELVERRYTDRVKTLLEGFVFAKLDESAYAEGIHTDRTLQLNSWTTVAVAPIAIRFPRDLPAGSAKALAPVERTLAEKRTEAGIVEEQERLLEFTYPPALIGEADRYEALAFEITSVRPVGELQLSLYSPVQQAWLPLEGERVELIPPAEAAEGGNRKASELRIREPDAILGPGARKLTLRYSYSRVKGTDRAQLRIQPMGRLKAAP